MDKWGSKQDLEPFHFCNHPVGYVSKDPLDWESTFMVLGTNRQPHFTEMNFRGLGNKPFPMPFRKHHQTLHPFEQSGSPLEGVGPQKWVLVDPQFGFKKLSCPKSAQTKGQPFEATKMHQKKVGMVGVRKLGGLLGAVDRHTGAVVVGTRPSRIHPDGVPGKRI